MGPLSAILRPVSEGDALRDKVVGSPEEAIADLADGASLAVTGFGTSYGFPASLLVAARDKNVRDLTLVTNNEREFQRVPQLRVENWAR